MTVKAVEGSGCGLCAIPACLKELNNTTKLLHQSGQETNAWSPEYRAGVLTTRRQCVWRWIIALWFCL